MSTPVHSAKREFGTPVSVKQELLAVNNETVDRLSRFEQLCQQLRVRSLGEPASVQEILAQPSLLHSINDLQLDVSSPNNFAGRQPKSF